MLRTKRAGRRAAGVGRARCPFDRALPATTLHPGAASGLARVVGVTIAIEVDRANLLRLRCRRVNGEREGDDAEQDQREARRPEEKAAHHRAVAVQARSAPASLTVCIMTTASGKVSRQTRSEENTSELQSLMHIS